MIILQLNMGYEYTLQNVFRKLQIKSYFKKRLKTVKKSVRLSKLTFFLQIINLILFAYLASFVFQYVTNSIVSKLGTTELESPLVIIVILFSLFFFNVILSPFKGFKLSLMFFFKTSLNLTLVIFIALLTLIQVYHYYQGRLKEILKESPAINL